VRRKRVLFRVRIGRVSITTRHWPRRRGRNVRGRFCSPPPLGPASASRLAIFRFRVRFRQHNNTRINYSFFRRTRIPVSVPCACRPRTSTILLRAYNGGRSRYTSGIHNRHCCATHSSMRARPPTVQPNNTNNNDSAPHKVNVLFRPCTECTRIICALYPFFRRPPESLIYIRFYTRPWAVVRSRRSDTLHRDKTNNNNNNNNNDVTAAVRRCAARSRSFHFRLRWTRDDNPVGRRVYEKNRNDALQTETLINAFKIIPDLVKVTIIYYCRCITHMYTHTTCARIVRERVRSGKLDEYDRAIINFPR